MVSWFRRREQEKMFCCQGFKNLVNNAGRAGISALVRNAQGAFSFKIQARAVSRDEESRLSNHPTPLPTKEPLLLSSNIGLNFCPFCGRELRSLVTSLTKRDFEVLAEKHKRFDEPFL
jgi:hypothetical protein